MSLERHLINHGHVHRFVVTMNQTGWDIHEEEDAAVVHHVHREDWHRVERDIRLFEIMALDLKRDGWIEN